MNGTTNTSDDRRLLAEISRWTRTNGWSTGNVGWINSRYEDTATIGVGWDDHSVRIWRKDAAPAEFFFPIRSVDYPAASVRQAVDLLVALGVLPVRFSSLAATMRRLADEMETEAAVHDAPAGSMFLDAGFRIRQTLDGEYEPTGDPR